jgi:hypothetical protein
VVNTDLNDLAVRLEEHEAAVWIECVAAAAELPGDPLRAVIDRSGPVPLVALCAVDGWDLNRVVALGVRSPVHAADLDAIWAFYEAHGQQNFRIDVTPVTRPPELADWITAKGMQRRSPGTFKIWRSVDPPLPVRPDVEVRQLGAEDADAYAELSLVAWGAWSTPEMHAWFRATVGCAGSQHYGIFDADRLVAAGAMFVGDGLAWFGFDATHPRHQGRKLRQAISAIRLTDAVKHGCRLIHAESTIPPRPRVFEDGWQSLYEKHNYSTVHADGVPEE